MGRFPDIQDWVFGSVTVEVSQTRNLLFFMTTHAGNVLQEVLPTADELFVAMSLYYDWTTASR